MQQYYIKLCFNRIILFLRSNFIDMTKYALFVFLFICTNAFGQGYKIDIQLDEQSDKEVKLTYHFLGKIYASDKTMLDSNGAGTLQGDSLLPQGLYKVFLDKDHHFDFLLGADQQFSIKNATFQSKDAEVKGAKETEEFVKYLIFLEDLKKKGSELNQQYKDAEESKKEEIKNKISSLTEEMNAYWDKIVEKYPGSFLSKFLLANKVNQLDISLLPKEVQENDSLLLLKRFDYQLKHYWDYFDYTDERLLYTPFYKSKLETWFNKVLYPEYDSVKPYVYQFLEDVKSSKRIFQFATSFFLNSSINSNVMGMDALFVDIARDFYFTGEAFWATEESLEEIRENVLFMKDNLIGEVAPDLTLESYDEEYMNLHQIESEITIVLIYEPNCSHCKVFVPEFYKDVYQEYKNKGLQVYAIYSMDDKDEWSEFLIKHNMFDWINVWDKDHLSRFKILYDARKTPGVYVLDRDKKIIAKKMTVEQLNSLLKDKLN